MMNNNQTLFVKHSFVGYFLTGCIFFFTATHLFAAPPNLTEVKKSIIAYQESGQYRKEITNIVQEAKNYLQQRAEENRQLADPKQLAIVLDIDETSLSNINFLKEHDFCINKEQIEEHFAAMDDSAIVPTLNLYRHAKQAGVAVFFITARAEKLRAPTEKNLINTGYYHWDGLYMKPDDSTGKNATYQFKLATRQKITAMGYTIILNIGDKDHDLAGRDAEVTYRLPNPFY
jgi:predicted secreted acid phosphatase